MVDTPKKRLLVGALLGGIFGLLLVHFGGYIWYSVQTILSRYQYDYSEGYELAVALDISKGINPYVNPNLIPMIIGYPPVMFSLVAILVKFMGPLLATGRIVSFAAGLLTGFILYLLGRKLSGKWWIGLLAAGFYYVSSITKLWTNLFRVDSLGVMFSLLGIYLTLSLKGYKRLWSVPIFLLAIFTKQSFIVAPIVVFAYYIISDKQFSLRFLGLLVFGGLLVLGVGTLVSGPYFIYNLTIYQSGYAWRWDEMFLGGLFIKAVLTVFVPLLLTIGYLYWTRGKWGLVQWYFIGASLLFIFTIAKIGSNWNYFLESIALMSLLVGLCLGKILSKDTQLVPRCIILGLVIFGLFQQPVILREPEVGSSEYQRIEGYVRETPGNIWSVDAALLLQNGKPVVLESGNFVAGSLLKKGYMDEGIVLSTLRGLSACILEYPVEALDGYGTEWQVRSAREHLTKNMQSVIQSDFQLKMSTGYFWIYEHK